MVVKKLLLGIGGMTCSSCSQTIENHCRSLEGIQSADITLATNTAVVIADTDIINEKKICDEVEDVGFDCEVLSCEVFHSLETIEIISTTEIENSSMKKYIIHIDSSIGIDSSIWTRLEAVLRKKAGVIEINNVGVNNHKPSMEILINDSVIGPRQLYEAALEEVGVTITISNHGGFMMAQRMSSQQSDEMRKHLTDAIVSLVLAIPVIVISHFTSMSMKHQHMSVLSKEIIPGLDVSSALLFLLSSPIQWIMGYRFHRKAILSIKSRSFGMDFMISTGTSVAYIFSTISLIRSIVNGKSNDMDVAYFSTAAVLITVVIIGKALEAYAKGRTSSAIQSLLKKRARVARLVTDLSSYSIAKSLGYFILSSKYLPMNSEENQDEQVDASLVNKGDCIRLVSGELVPADGYVVTGYVGIDESMLTGESVVMSKSVKSPVYGGTMVVEGSAVIVVTACGDDSILGKIVSTVQEAQSSKPPIQELADRVAQYFVPIVASISIVTFLVWISAFFCGVIPETLYGNENPILFAFFFALAVWVSACPCAFGLATPTAILVSTGVAAKYGILIRRGAVLQHAAEIQAIAFDKTGTLTIGKPQVSDFLYFNESEDSKNKLNRFFFHSDDNDNDDEKVQISEEVMMMIQYLLLAESKSNHPIARGIVDYCRLILARSSTAAPPTTSINEDDFTFEVFPGQGLSLKNESTQILVGSQEFQSSQGISIPISVSNTTERLRQVGKVVIFMSISSKLKAIIGLSDTVRPEAYTTLSYLRKQGYQCYMITGDAESTATAIGRSLGFRQEEIYANSKPGDKEAIVRAIQESGHKLKCLFIGDGTNDSPAMARATVSIAMSQGTDIAMEVGDVVFCKNDISSLPILLKLARMTLTRIKMNYVWALCYNIILIPVAAGVLYPHYHFKLAPMLAGLAMAMSSISIVISSLMIGLFHPPDIVDSFKADILKYGEVDVESAPLLGGPVMTPFDIEMMDETLSSTSSSSHALSIRSILV